MTDIAITPTATGKRLLVTSPHNTNFDADIANIGGRRNSQRRCWTVAAEDEERVRDLLRTHYGTDGSPGETADTVSVQVRLADHEGPSWDPKATFAGRTIAWRESRDAPVKLARDVILVAGRLPHSGGSVKNPRIAADSDVIVEVRGVPRGALARYAPKNYTIIDTAAPGEPDVEKLLGRRARLIEQLADLDQLLAQIHPGELEELGLRPDPAIARMQREMEARLSEERARAQLDLAQHIERQEQRRQERERATAAQEERERRERQERQERERQAVAAAPLSCRCGGHTCPPDAPTAAAYAAQQGVTVQTVRNRIGRGVLVGVKFGGRLYVIPPPATDQERS